MLCCAVAGVEHMHMQGQSVAKPKHVPPTSDATFNKTQQMQNGSALVFFWQFLVHLVCKDFILAEGTCLHIEVPSTELLR